ncbi:GNAT family N-acetyltransferase [Cellulosimicrobium marinum]|uniref:GNAT family N-acetyltransferase n=1 Tax=Cellulosimicrobium marinum TaxID=1638992 RepID=UPI001E5C717E|nr:GNAT family N-acetyltransferase [Cellulosimicrobium marinum]MCB7137595.1 GNAT family N-acetyltransferase [Cellulosimicrobium marinum]
MTTGAAREGPFPPPWLALPGAAALLRTFRREDAALGVELSRVDDVPRWTFVPPRMSAVEADEWAARAVSRARDGSSARYVVELDGRAVGTAGLSGIDGAAPEVFYALLPRARGLGLATRAVASLGAWALAAGAEEVRLVTRLGNGPSEAVARRAGFVLVDEATDPRDGASVRVWALRDAGAPPTL